MIVILKLEKFGEIRVNPEDTLVLSYNSAREGATVLLRQSFSNPTTFDRAVAFVFANEDGYCTSPNVCGAFLNSGCIPVEFLLATFVHELKSEQLENFIATAPAGTVAA